MPLVRPVPLFVASLPRSGSTWVASTLGGAPGVTYYHEPFNYKAVPAAEPLVMRYLAAGERDDGFARHCAPAFAGRMRHRFVTSKQPTWKRVWPWPVGRPLVKDVHSMLALGWIQAEMRPRTVVVTRHPCGCAESWSRLRMQQGRTFQRLLGQPRLWTDHLAPFADVLHAAQDFWERAGAYWGAVHYVARRQLEGADNCRWVKHEDLCRAPVEEFRRLVRWMELPWTRALEQRIVRDSSCDSGEAFVPQRRSHEEVDKWQARLAPDAVDKVRRFAEPFGLLGYTFPAATILSARAATPGSTASA